MTPTQEKVFTGKDSGEKAEAQGGPETRQARLWPYVDGQFVSDMPLGWIAPWTHNPRKVFDDAPLRELSESIEMDGVRQPIEVRTLPEAEMFSDYPAARVQIVMGERRWRAAALAGRLTMPCIVRVGMDDATALRLAVVENLRRTDLNAMEESDSYNALLEAGFKQNEIAGQIGVSEGTISNALRLRRLPADVREMVVDGRLSGSHARALLRFEGFDRVMNLIAAFASELGSPVRALEKGIPFATNLIQAKAIEAFADWNTAFDLNICLQCPFGAYRKSESSGQHFCLKPEHYAELQAAAKAEKQARIDAARAESLAAARRGAEASQAEGASAAGIARKADIPDAVFLDTPENAEVPGCSAQCECRGVLLDFAGAARPACLQGTRLQALKNKVTHETRRELKFDFSQRETDFIELLEEAGGDSPILRRVAAFIVWNGLQRASARAKGELAPLLDGDLREAALLLKEAHYNIKEETARAVLAKLPVVSQLILLARVEARAEIIYQIESKRANLPDMDFMAGREVADLPAPAPLEPAQIAEAEPPFAEEGQRVAVRFHLEIGGAESSEWKTGTVQPIDALNHTFQRVTVLLDGEEAPRHFAPSDLRLLDVQDASKPDEWEDPTCQNCGGKRARAGATLCRSCEAEVSEEVAA